MGLILLHVAYEYAMLGSLQIPLYSNLSCVSDSVFTCSLIPDFLLAAIEMQSSCLATDHEFRMWTITGMEHLGGGFRSCITLHPEYCC